MSITVPTGDNPTPTSRKAWVGAAWGNLIAIIPAIFASMINPFLGMATSLAGIMGGYFVGKNVGGQQKERELQQGSKEIKSPSYWNRGLAKGWVISGLLGIAATTLNLLLFPGSNIGGYLQMGSGIAGLGIMIAESIRTKREMVREYEEGVKARDAQPISPAAGKDRGTSPEMNTPGVEVNEPQNTKFAHAEENRRAAPAAQQTQMG